MGNFTELSTFCIFRFQKMGRWLNLESMDHVRARPSVYYANNAGLNTYILLVLVIAVLRSRFP